MTDDLWGIADDVDTLAESWNPDDAYEAPSIPDRADWLRRRLLALRFTRAELDETAAAYDAEISRLTNARAAAVAPLERNAAALEAQLLAYHAAVVREEEAAWRVRAAAAVAAGEEPPKLRVSSTIKTPHGTLRSGGGRATVRVTNRDEALTWLRTNALDAVRHVPESWEVDLSKAPGLAVFDPLGDPLGVGVVNADGEREFCPGLEVLPPKRWHKVDPA